MPGTQLPEHAYRVNNRQVELEKPPSTLEKLSALRSEIEPWITSLLASEHLSLLIGSGLTTALTTLVDADPVDMAPAQFDLEHAEQVDNAAQAFAKVAHRGEANIEDQVRAALDLIAGLRVVEDPAASTWETSLTDTLTQFATRVLAAEAALQPDISDDSDAVRRALDLLASFLASFVSRTATKERLHIFTTNYDRVVEAGLDEAGVWKIDRFIGSIAPKFRASRLEIDLHYSPPGIRGEPHYLEGVARLTKLHGSIDWFADGVDVGRIPIPFGTSSEIFNGLLPPENLCSSTQTQPRTWRRVSTPTRSSFGISRPRSSDQILC